MKRIFHFILFVLVALFVFASCKTNEIIYLKDKSVIFSEDEKDSLYTTRSSTYRLQTDDYLYVRIFSPEKIVEEELKSQNTTSGGQSENLSRKEDYLNGYVVSDSGHIELPIMGKVKVGGLTEKEAEKMVQKRVNNFLINAKAVVKLLSFKVTFMGEVGQKGVMYFYQREVNIFEGLASVGGISDYGKLKNVLILRKQGKGYKSTRVDLTDRSLLTDPKFFLRPNDIVYVEPNKSKIYRLSLNDYAMLISTIASTITTFLLVINLSK